VVTLLGTAGTVGAANALNCWIERDRDRLMARTRLRPLPSGRMESGVALAFGILLAVFSLPLLAMASNGLTGSLGFLALVSYVAAYTPLKPKSPMAMLVGAIPGALPPLMGWTAVTGKIGLGGLLLFGILFAWQMPHFLAIALFRKEEYRSAGYMALPLVRGDDATRVWMLVWTVVLVILSVLLVPLGVAGPFYLAVALVLGGASGCSSPGACCAASRRPGRARRSSSASCTWPGSSPRSSSPPARTEPRRWRATARFLERPPGAGD
jgi:protoheme IX farnesyltransferase